MKIRALLLDAKGGLREEKADRIHTHTHTRTHHRTCSWSFPWEHTHPFSWSFPWEHTHHSHSSDLSCEKPEGLFPETSGADQDYHLWERETTTWERGGFRHEWPKDPAGLILSAEQWWTASNQGEARPHSLLALDPRSSASGRPEPGPTGVRHAPRCAKWDSCVWAWHHQTPWWGKDCCPHPQPRHSTVTGQGATLQQRPWGSPLSVQGWGGGFTQGPRGPQRLHGGLPRASTRWVGLWAASHPPRLWLEPPLWSGWRLGCDRSCCFKEKTTRFWF